MPQKKQPVFKDTPENELGFMPDDIDDAIANDLGFTPDNVGFTATPAPTAPAHGVEPAPLFANRPFGAPTLDDLKSFGRGLKRTWEGAGEMSKELLSSPLTYLNPLAAGVKAFVADPAYAEGEKAGAAFQEGRTSEGIGHSVAGVLPGIGPMAAQWGEELGAGTPAAQVLGEAAGVYVLGKGTNAAIAKAGPTLRSLAELSELPGVRLSSVPSRTQINNLATISRSPAIDVVEVQPLLKEWFQQAGVDPNRISIKERGGSMDLVGDLQRGLQEFEYNALAKRLGKDPRRMGPLPIEAATGAVDLADRPFKLAMDRYGDTPTMDIAKNIEGQLRKAAADTIDDGLRRAYTSLADKVRAEGSTMRGLNNVKVWANKEGASLFNMSPGGQINATAKPISAYADVGSMIRREMYPRLEQMSKGQLDLANAGRIEGQAIKFRDNVYKVWQDVAAEHATQANNAQTLTGRAKNVMGSINPLTQNRKTMALGATKALMGRTVLQDFNRLFKEGVGGVEGWSPKDPLPVHLLSEVSNQRLLPAGLPLPPPADTSMAAGSPALAEAGTRATRKGLLIPETASPSPVSVPGQPVVSQGAQVRGVEPPVVGQLPMTPSRLDFGSGRVPVTTNQQLGGTASTPPLRSPAGPGELLTRDPRVIQSTLQAIDDALASGKLTQGQRMELTLARQKLTAQLPIPPPPIKFNR